MTCICPPFPQSSNSDRTPKRHAKVILFFITIRQILILLIDIEAPGHSPRTTQWALDQEHIAKRAVREPRRDLKHQSYQMCGRTEKDGTGFVD